VSEASAEWVQQGQTPFSIQAFPVSYPSEEAGNQVWISPDAAVWAWNFGVSTPTGRTDLRSGPGEVLGLGESDNLD
jgi:hypothetical protein